MNLIDKFLGTSCKFHQDMLIDMKVQCDHQIAEMQTKINLMEVKVKGYNDEVNEWVTKSIELQDKHASIDLTIQNKHSEEIDDLEEEIEYLKYKLGKKNND